MKHTIYFKELRASLPKCPDFLDRSTRQE